MLRKLLDTLKVGVRVIKTMPKHLAFMRRSCVLPEQCVLLGDKNYPNDNCIMTPYTVAQLARKEDRMKRKCEKLNYYRNIRYYRIVLQSYP